MTVTDFDAYPPLAKQVAAKQLDLFHEMPVPFLALLLRELINWDWKFPAERKQLDGQFAYLRSMSSDARKTLFLPFANLKLSPKLEASDWINTPASFSEQLSAHLWASHQIDSFRAAAVNFFNGFNAAVPDLPPAMPRLAIVALGQGVQQNTYTLFRKLKRHGTYFENVSTTDAIETCVEALNTRAKKYAEQFAHWHIDGAPIDRAGPQVTSVSYDALTPTRARLQEKMRQLFESDMGPEAFRSLLARMTPRDLGMDESADPVRTRFELTLLTEGSGTQVFSTTFVQWAAREALRRAQPVTLFARFTPRQQDRPMNALLTEAASKPKLDPQASLIDADMGAYYTWLNQQRLAGANQSTFLAWFEGGREAVAIGPNFGLASRSDPISLESILRTLI